MKQNNRLVVGTLLISALLNGCGGGGGSGSNEGSGGGSGANSGSPAVSTGNAAQGVYEGVYSNGNAHFTVVLDNGQYYAIYGTAVGGIFVPAGFIQGNGQANNGTYTSTDLKDFPFVGLPASGSLSASYTPALKFDGTVTKGSSTATFTGTPPAAANYNYNTSAKREDLVGAWVIGGSAGTPSPLNIAADGSFTGSRGGCSFSGTLAPRASGKNVFDVTLNYGASPCKLANQSTPGIAVSFNLNNGKRLLFIASVDGPRNNGVLIGAER